VHESQKNFHLFYCLHNSIKTLPILTIFGVLNPEKNWHENFTDLSTSPVTCTTLPWEIQKIHFQQYYSCILPIIYVIWEENYNPLFPTTGKCHYTKLWIAKLCSSVALFQKLEDMKRASCGSSSVALKRTGCGVWRLECQANNVTASVHWPPSALIRNPSLFRHWSVA